MSLPRRFLLTSLPLLLALLVPLGGRRAHADPVDTTALRMLVEGLASLRDEIEAPGLTLDEAAANLKTPSAAFRFVRDEVAFLPYRGPWHSPEAVLKLRVANSRDKAALLRYLLRKMGHDPRLVGAPWPEGAVPLHTARDQRRPRALERLERLLDRRPDAPREGRAELAALRAEVAAARDAIALRLARANLGARLEGRPEGAASPVTPEHWAWVELPTRSGPPVVLDPTFPERARPEEDVQQLELRTANTNLRVFAGTTLLVEWKGHASTLFTQDAQILIVPEGKDLSVAARPATVKRWLPLLQIGAKRLKGKAFTPGAQGVDALRLEVDLPDFFARAWETTGRTLMRFDRDFDPNRLVSLYRIGSGVGYVPYAVRVARQIDEVLDLRDLKRAGLDAFSQGARAHRGIASRTARVLDSMFRLQPALLPEPIELGWQGPALFIESVALAQGENGLASVARIDILRQAFRPAPSATRLQRLTWGLATLAVEGHLLRTQSVNEHLAAQPEALRIVGSVKDAPRLAHNPIASGTLARGGLVLTSAQAPRMAWSLEASGDLYGTVTGAGATAKGGEARAQAAGQAYGALGGAAMGALGAPSGMLVGGIAGYLNELAKAYRGAAGVLEGLGRTIETGDDRHVLAALGKYRGDLGRRLWRALGEGAARGFAESALGAGAGRLLPTSGNPYGPTVGDRLMEGAVAGGLAYPQDLPVVSEAIRRAADALMR